MSRLAQILQYLLALHGTPYWQELAPLLLAILRSYAGHLEPKVIPMRKDGDGRQDRL